MATEPRSATSETSTGTSPTGAHSSTGATGAHAASDTRHDTDARRAREAETHRGQHTEMRYETEARRGGGVENQISGAFAGTLEATGDVARTAIVEVSNVAEELVHAVGRVGASAVSEVFALIGIAAGGLGNTAGALMGRRNPRDDYRSDRTRRDETRETTRDTQAAAAL